MQSPKLIVRDSQYNFNKKFILTRYCTRRQRCFL